MRKEEGEDVGESTRTNNETSHNNSALHKLYVTVTYLTFCATSSDPVVTWSFSAERDSASALSCRMSWSACTRRESSTWKERGREGRREKRREVEEGEGEERRKGKVTTAMRRVKGRRAGLERDEKGRTTEGHY